VEQQDTPKEEAMVEIIGTLEEWYGDQHLAAGRRRPKKWTQGDDESQ
jgi:hypothetical protein